MGPRQAVLPKIHPTAVMSTIYVVPLQTVMELRRVFSLFNKIINILNFYILSSFKELHNYSNLQEHFIFLCKGNFLVFQGIFSLRNLCKDRYLLNRNWKLLNTVYERKTSRLDCYPVTKEINMVYSYLNKMLRELFSLIPDVQFSLIADFTWFNYLSGTWLNPSFAFLQGAHHSGLYVLFHII